MKSLALATLLAFCSPFAQAKNGSFDAVITDNKLHVALVTDGCNAYNVELDIPQSCKADRMTRNWAVACNVSLRVMATEMACHNTPAATQLFVIDLKEAGLADEAAQLTLHYLGQSLTIERQ